MRSRLRSLAALAILAAAAGCGGFATGTVDIHPSETTVLQGLSTTFTVEMKECPGSKVDWSVDEFGGGSIGDDGVYAAPFSPGTYHVTATCHEDRRISDTATVYVE